MLKETTGAFSGVRSHDWHASTDYESDALPTAPRPIKHKLHWHLLYTKEMQHNIQTAYIATKDKLIFLTQEYTLRGPICFFSQQSKIDNAVRLSLSLLQLLPFLQNKPILSNYLIFVVVGVIIIIICRSKSNNISNNIKKKRWQWRNYLLHHDVILVKIQNLTNVFIDTWCKRRSSWTF